MDYDTVIELSEVTLEDCTDLYEKKSVPLLWMVELSILNKESD